MNDDMTTKSFGELRKMLHRTLLVSRVNDLICNTLFFHRNVPSLPSHTDAELERLCDAIIADANGAEPSYMNVLSVIYGERE